MNIFELSKSILAEFTGSTFVGFLIGWIEFEKRYQFAYSNLTPSVVQALIITVFSFVYMGYSGANFNPIITLVLIISKRLRSIKGIFYFIAQLLGYFLAVIMLMIFMPTEDKEVGSNLLCYGCANIEDNFGIISALIAEFISGFLIVYTYYAFIVDKRSKKDFYGIALGLVVLLINIAFSFGMIIMFNPSRYLAGAILNWNFSYYYVYLLPSFFGALWASWLFEKFILSDQPKKSEQTLNLD